MLNLKKGLALVLAAATAFTFAPVANLGASVDAHAGDILKVDSTETINLHNGETRWIETQDISQKQWISTEATTLEVESGNENVAKVALDGSNISVPGTLNTSVTGAVANQQISSTTAKYLWVKATGVGSTTISLRVLTSSGDIIGKENLTVNVESKVANITFAKDKVEYTKVNDAGSASDYLAPGETTPTSGQWAQTVNLYNLHSALPTGAHLKSLKATSADEKIAKVVGTNPITLTSTNEVDTKQSQTFTIEAEGVGTTTIDVDVIYTIGGSDSTLVSASFNVVVNDGTDTLKVSYDPSRTGKNQDVKLTTKPDATVGSATTDYFNSSDWTSTGTVTSGEYYAYAGKDFYTGVTASGSTTVTELYRTGSQIYLDTISNKTAKLDINDSYGRQYTISSSVSWIAVDNSGNITVSNPTQSGTFGNNNTYSGYVKVSVAKTTVSSKTLAGLTIYVPVTVYNKDTTTLQVKEKDNQKDLGKTVGGQAGQLKTSEWAKLPRLYLSIKDKKSSTLEFTTNTASDDRYITGAAYDAADPTKLSDIVTYANGTLTANKAGNAFVQLICRNSADTYGQATVTFAVQVVTKNANNKITTTADTYNLTKDAPKASIGAKATYETKLKYDLVKGIGSNDVISASSDITLDGNGNLTYTSSNQGTIYVRITGNETTTALAPDTKWVTVNYTGAKAANDLKVTNSKLELKPGESGTIGATASTGSAISYKSSDENVATVDANGNVTAKAIGAAFITVDAAATDTVAAGQQIVTVLVSQEGGITATPEKVTGLKVSNKKGAYVSVKWASQGKNINYRVWKKIGNGKWVGKNVAGNKTTLSVKKGTKVQVKVKAYVKDTNGKTTWGPKATKAKTFKTDKK